MQKHICSWSLKLIFCSFEVLMSTSKLPSMKAKLQLEIYFWWYQLISLRKFPPYENSPPLLGHFEKQGGNFRLFRPEAEIFQDCDIENICVPFKIDRNERKIVFSKRKTSKFSRLRRGYTPSSPKIFRACGAATTQAIIQIIIIQMTFFEK